VLLAGLLLAGCERAPLGYDAMALGPIELTVAVFCPRSVPVSIARVQAVAQSVTK
jgi:hypothetical protein